jgi:hypothetical protein
LLYFEKAAASLPGDANLLRQVGRVFEAAGRGARAREYYLKADQVNAN